MFYIAAEMILELEYPNKSIDIRTPHWHRSGAMNIREDDFSRVTITLVDEKTLNVRLEQMDFFGMESGLWTPDEHPQREQILRDIIAQIEKATGIKTKIKNIRRECY